ncbi:MAG: hypothetical protein HQ445_07875 [Polaromonas sp.]|nr:hypothetical protein [Polaromonas sp.]
MSIAICEFCKLAVGVVMRPMQTASETRRTRLEMLIKRFQTAAALNTALGWARTDPKLAQIRNANPRPGRDKPYQMGDAMAREIEEKLGLQRGWMDTAPSYAEIGDGNDPRAMIEHMVNDLSPEDWPTALRLLGALKKPEQKNGTSN